MVQDIRERFRVLGRGPILGSDAAQTHGLPTVALQVVPDPAPLAGEPHGRVADLRPGAAGSYSEWGSVGFPIPVCIIGMNIEMCHPGRPSRNVVRSSLDRTFIDHPSSVKTRRGTALILCLPWETATLTP
jgi:hypothetical protein